METVLLSLHLLIAIALIGVVLLQRSEGGALGIGSGGGGGGNLFSSRGVGNVLTRTTAILALAFFVTSISLTLLATRGSVGGSVFDGVQSQETAPSNGAVSPVLPQLPAAPTEPQVPVQQ
jgi:preprotein translocase subunit SecG